jgi:two-component system cell cycle response regulator
MSRHLDTLVSSARRAARPLAFVIMDIDFFKQVNDTYGHDIGDEVLKEFANRIGANVRGIDLACRYGGEEFVVVMPDTDMSFRLQHLRAAAPVDRDHAGQDQPRPHVLNITISIALPAWKMATPARKPCCAAPTRRCIAPSGRAETRSSLTRRSFCF